MNDLLFGQIYLEATAGWRLIASIVARSVSVILTLSLKIIVHSSSGEPFSF